MRAAKLAEVKGADIAKLAVQFSTSHPSIPTTLVSTANPDNIIRNAAWIEEPIDEELLNEILQILQPIHNVTWESGIPLYNK